MATLTKVGWDRFPDGAEFLCLYDRDDGSFGYALNATWQAGEAGTV